MCLSARATGRGGYSGRASGSRSPTRLQRPDEDLDSARAEETILDQRLITLDDEAYKAFLAMLDTPAKPDKAVRTRMSRMPAWER